MMKKTIKVSKLYLKGATKRIKILVKQRISSLVSLRDRAHCLNLKIYTPKTKTKKLSKSLIKIEALNEMQDA